MEIKLRAWDKPNKRMLFFSRLEWHDEYGLLYFAEGELDVPVADNLIFMQFTGLKDKTGKEIYEGDIVKANNLNYEVFYDTNMAQYRLRNKNLTIFQYRKIYGRTLEVIGDIYRNSLKINEVDKYEI